MVFLIKDYGLAYRYQKFENGYNANWIIETHSFYNDSGCFTMRRLAQRDEWDFYYAARFATGHEALCEKMINIYAMETEIWNKRSKIAGFNNPFFWLSSSRVLRTFAEVLKTHLSKENEFWGIKV